MKAIKIPSLYAIWLFIACLVVQGCALTGEKFVPQNPQETIALSAVTIKAFAKSVKLAYTQRLISQEAAQSAHDRLQVAQTALVSAKAATTPEDQQSALVTVQQALTVVASILESMQEPAQ
jgi:hypothetical protein